MYYVKTKINDEVETKVEITDENVFTCCAECGKEMPVDLRDIFKYGGNLCSTSLFCGIECSEKYVEKHGEK